MAYGFVVGGLIGFLVCFLGLKRAVRKSGAGELKLCRECPHLLRRKETVNAESSLQSQSNEE